jgi:predicted nucleic acid-binding protein
VFPEEGSARADALIGDFVATGTRIHAPDLLFAELANLGWKKVRRLQATPAAVHGLLRVARSLGLRLWPSEQLADAAFEVALALGCSAYDGVYLALTQRLAGVLHTADRRLIALVRGTPLEKAVAPVG